MRRQETDITDKNYIVSKNNCNIYKTEDIKMSGRAKVRFSSE